MLICAYFSFASLSWSAIDVLNFSSPQQEETYHRLTQELRCPQCQNNNIADSNALIAQDMRSKVFALLQEGKTEQDIVQYMVARYGNFVTYDPPLTFSTIVLWIVPLGILVLALFILWHPRFLFNKLDNNFNNSSQNFSEIEGILQNDEISLSSEEQQRLQTLLEKKDK